MYETFDLCIYPLIPYPAYRYWKSRPIYGNMTCIHTQKQEKDTKSTQVGAPTAAAREASQARLCPGSRSKALASLEWATRRGSRLPTVPEAARWRRTTRDSPAVVDLMTWRVNLNPPKAHHKKYMLSSVPSACLEVHMSQTTFQLPYVAA